MDHKSAVLVPTGSGGSGGSGSGSGSGDGDTALLAASTAQAQALITAGAVTDVSVVERTALQLLIHILRKLVDGERQLELMRASLVRHSEFDVWQLFAHLDIKSLVFSHLSISLSLSVVTKLIPIACRLLT